MTQSTPIRRDARTGDHLDVALRLAAAGLPVLPLRADKGPLGNCPNCTGNECGGRPNMKTPGSCQCPRPCHAWAAATTAPTVLSSAPWKAAWRHAGAVAYHPGGAGLTVVDLDNAAAVTWARTTLPPTRTVATTRGEHWIYQGTTRSVNGVRAGVDLKSTQSYVRWCGPGTGTMAVLPDVVRSLATTKSTVGRPAAHALTVAASASGGPCPHRSPAYLERGIAMAEQRIADTASRVHSTVYRTFLAVLSTHGRCGCLTETHIDRLFTAAQAKGESPRHCTDAWTNATAALGM
ncbi:DNA primase [Streptomyces sp. NPDC090301]|uniref:bifunctional DNA primase/polymerase n=1 Tax=Streptomyces sp. NPDC090301 TaxID=3154975 RepID=UPI003425DDF7